MSEDDFTNSLVSKLSSLLKSCKIGTKIPLLYAITVDESGNIEPGLNKEGLPKRGGGTGFEQDILLFEDSDGQTKIIPRVAIEVKFQGVTTHDSLVYSEKAHRIRNIYPYLRYGLILGDLERIPPRTMRLGNEFDFIISINSSPSPSELDELSQLLQNECETSRKLGKAYAGKAKVRLLYRHTEMQIEHFQFGTPSTLAVNPTTMSLVKAKDSKVITDFSKPSYYVYENWRAENKAKIHRGECTFCNYGKGIHPEAGQRNGRWHGSFSTFEDAYECAKGTGREVSYCKVCVPQ